MTPESTQLQQQLRKLHTSGGLDLPLPGRGSTPERHRRLAAIGRQDLSLARLAEAHVDAVAILKEAGREPEAGALYGVWASEIPGRPLRLDKTGDRATLAGSKMFCTGAGLVDRALITVTTPAHLLIDVDLRADPATVVFDTASWKASAFAETRTATAIFHGSTVTDLDIVGEPGFYLERAGFWHGACGPAACWAGGAMALVDYALAQSRDDPHTLAHLGAMKADAWALSAYLDCAGREIDSNPQDRKAAQATALTVRHLIETACSDILRRIVRAYGPRLLAYEEAILHRYQELDLYVRQSHAERDLEVLGRLSKLA